VTFLDVAALGTSRQQGGVPATGTPVDALTQSLDSVAATGDERSVLLRAGALAVYHRAGRRPEAAIHPPERAPADRLPEPAPQVARLLRELTHGTPRDLLREACERLARAGSRLPAALLPAVLDLKDLQEALAPVLGERGRWLARFRPEWAWALAPAPDAVAALPADAERTWQEGQFDARLAVLRALRASDPARARAWVEAAWTGEKSEQRAELLVAFAAGLAPADEAFLEGALDDRSQVVRTVAAELLARLPDSQLARRVADRASTLLSYAPPAGGAWARVKSTIAGPPVGVLTASPPPTLDASWARDGIPPKPPKGMGERAHWLAALLALVPPARWEERLGATPAALVAAAWAGEWGFAVALGWSRATLLHQAPGWAARLWDGWLHATRLAGAEAAVRREMLQLLLRRMDPADAEARVLADISRLAGLVVDLRAPWSSRFGRGYLDALERELRAQQPALELVESVARAAIALPPDCFARALELGPRAEPAAGVYSLWKKPFESFTEVVQLRRRIYEEIPT